MRDNRLHTPVGFRDVLPYECSIKNEIINEIRNEFEGYAYKAVESPSLEYIEVFSDENRGGTDPKLMYKYFDREGATLAMRSDMTPGIARIAATAFSENESPLRFYYVGNTFKTSGSYQGKLYETTQAGVELMGVNSYEADAEIIVLAIKSILKSGIKDFRINIGQVKLFKAILDETGLSEEECENIKDTIAQRDYVALENIINNCNISENGKTILSKLTKLVGKNEVLDYVKGLTKSEEALNALDELKKLYNILKIHGVDRYVYFDLGMINHLNYYTGIIFTGYTYGTGYSIVGGGRYDNLVSGFGKDMPAVGFTININEIVSIVEKIAEFQEKPKTLIAWEDKGKITAYKIGLTYRDNGMIVQNSFIYNDFDANFKYAKENGIAHMLYFEDSENLKVVSFLDEMGGYTVSAKVSDLVLPKKEDE